MANALKFALCLLTRSCQEGSAAGQAKPRQALGLVIPLRGLLVTGDRSAYAYLTRSTESFLPPHKLAAQMEGAGFRDVGYRLFMFGTIAVHSGERPLP